MRPYSIFDIIANHKFSGERIWRVKKFVLNTKYLQGVASSTISFFLVYCFPLVVFAMISFLPRWCNISTPCCCCWRIFYSYHFCKKIHIQLCVIILKPALSSFFFELQWPGSSRSYWAQMLSTGHGWWMSIRCHGFPPPLQCNKLAGSFRGGLKIIQETHSDSN